MRYGILSDIHSNLEALRTVVDLTQKEGVEKFLCLGDIVGYGANPTECLDVIRELRAVCVAGNHDWAVAGKLSAESFNLVAKEAAYWTREQLSKEDIRFLSGLELVYKNDHCILVHGTLSKPERFRYMMYMSEAEETFCLMERNICFIGHTHAPQTIIRQGEAARCSDVFKVKINPENKYIINVGSVGQPRDGNPMAAYGIYDTDTHVVEIKRTPYDIERAQAKILEAGLPVSLAERLAVGH